MVRAWAASVPAGDIGTVWSSNASGVVERKTKGSFAQPDIIMNS